VDPTQFIHSGIPIFKNLSLEERQKIAKMMNHTKIGRARTIFKQGQTGDAFYAIMSGIAHVLVHDENYLKVGDKVRTKRDVHFAGNVFWQEH
jgi:CRP-like cAMP-binding protein